MQNNKLWINVSILKAMNCFNVVLLTLWDRCTSHNSTEAPSFNFWWRWCFPSAHNHWGPRGCSGQLSHSPHCHQLDAVPEIWPFSPKIWKFDISCHLQGSDPPQILSKVNVQSIPMVKIIKLKMSGKLSINYQIYYIYDIGTNILYLVMTLGSKAF